MTTGFDFVKSSYSSGSGECVEVAHNIPHTIAVRDSKTPHACDLILTPASWKVFVAALTGDRLT
ncbi:DUF397 domain-containing protein [Streptomyces sp. NPDC001340]